MPTKTKVFFGFCWLLLQKLCVDILLQKTWQTEKSPKKIKITCHINMNVTPLVKAEKTHRIRDDPGRSSQSQDLLMPTHQPLQKSQPEPLFWLSNVSTVAWFPEPLHFYTRPTGIRTQEGCRDNLKLFVPPTLQLDRILEVHVVLPPCLSLFVQKEIGMEG